MTQIEYLDTKSIKPYERNAKKHPKEQIQFIANSLERFGWKQPIVIDKNNVVIVGHGRLLAAKKLAQQARFEHGETPKICCSVGA